MKYNTFFMWRRSTSFASILTNTISTPT